ADGRDRATAGAGSTPARRPPPIPARGGAAVAGGRRGGGPARRAHLAGGRPLGALPGEPDGGDGGAGARALGRRRRRRRLLAGGPRVQDAAGRRAEGRVMVCSRLRLSWIENVRFALGAMRAQKLRTFLTLLGVVAGVATVIMMVSFVTGFDRSVTQAFSRFGTQLVQFQKYEPRFGSGPGDVPEEQRNRRDLTLEDA